MLDNDKGEDAMDQMMNDNKDKTPGYLRDPAKPSGKSTQYSEGGLSRACKLGMNTSHKCQHMVCKDDCWKEYGATAPGRGNRSSRKDNKIARVDGCDHKNALTFEAVNDKRYICSDLSYNTKPGVVLPKFCHICGNDVVWKKCHSVSKKA